MTDHPTYDLRDNSGHSDAFYIELEHSARRCHDYLSRHAGGLLSAYRVFVTGTLGEPPRSDGEYGIELLTLGMLWRRYLGASARTPRPAVSALTSLYRLRSRIPALKPYVDPLRGRLSAALLLPHVDAVADHEMRDVRTLGRLLRWLDCSGEFPHEVRRLRNWLQLLRSMPPGEAALALTTAIEAAAWFRDTAERNLGRYTAGVDGFLRECHPAYRGREDAFFCGKPREEYHLNMLAFSMMNEGLRKEFAAMPKRAVLLPGCMRPDGASGCRAGGSMRCAGCSRACNIDIITRLGRRHGFEVHIVPHTSSFTRWLRRWEGTREYGVVAVACLPNIAVGGYEMRALDIPSQCVLLDCSGCAKHWRAGDVMTGCNVSILLDTVLQGLPRREGVPAALRAMSAA